MKQGLQGEVGPKGDTGPQGVSVMEIVDNQDETMTIKLSNKREYVIKLPKGLDGLNGLQGETGPEVFKRSHVSYGPPQVDTDDMKLFYFQLNSENKKIIMLKTTQGLRSKYSFIKQCLEDQKELDLCQLEQVITQEIIPNLKYYSDAFTELTLRVSNGIRSLPSKYNKKEYKKRLDLILEDLDYNISRCEVLAVLLINLRASNFSYIKQFFIYIIKFLTACNTDSVIININ
jgi:hypothetical protein